MAIDQSAVDVIVRRFARDEVEFLIEKVHGSLYYIGVTRTLGASENKPLWIVFRISNTGVSTKAIQSGSKFDKKWDDRATLFPVAPPPPNAHCLDLDGINDKVVFPGLAEYDVSDAFSVSLWVKPQNTAARRALFAKTTNDASVYGFVLYHENNGQLYLQMRTSGGLRSHTFDLVLPAGVWSHVVLTYQGGLNINGARTYIDKVKSTSNPASGSLPNSWLNGQDFTMGSRQSAFYFSGLMDSMTIWNTALTDDDVDELYASKKIIDPESHSKVSNLRHNYDMEAEVYPTITDKKGAINGTMTGMAADDFSEDVL